MRVYVSANPFVFSGSIGFICSPSHYHHQIGSMNLSSRHMVVSVSMIVMFSWFDNMDQEKADFVSTDTVQSRIHSLFQTTHKGHSICRSRASVGNGVSVVRS